MRLAMAFYVLELMFLGCFLVGFAAHWIDFDLVVNILLVIYYHPKLRMIFIITGAGLLFINYIFARLVSGSQQREKTIAFDNPSGRVSVSLPAMEDLIKRIMSRVPEVKEVKPAISASKKGLEVNVRMVLRADVNIPEMTSKLQDVIKTKIQDTIGLEETIVVKIHVSKIIPEELKYKKSKDSPDDSQPTVPFQGYRA